LTTRQQALDEVSRYCDIRERLPLVPPSARCRGVWFSNIEAVLDRAGRLERYRAVFPEHFATMSWHPVSEFLVRLVVAGGLVTSPSTVHEGMFEIGRRNAVAIAESLLGRMLFRLLSRDPKKLLQQGAAGRRLSTDSGTWSLSFPAERTAVMRLDEEYTYIESYILGGGQGSFDAIGLPVRSTVKLEDPFHGSHTWEW
jgi:uncharacterized protein (TIGR02265 family)